jgi:hypothetical protein
MKYLTLSLVGFIFLINGCGSSSSTPISNSEETPKITTVEEAKSNFKALSGLKTLGSIGNKLSTNTQQKGSLQKSGTQNCDSGTMTYSISEDEKNINFSSNQCRLDDTTINGSMKMVTLSDGSERVEFQNLSISSPKESFSSKSLLFVSNETAKWSSIDGDLKITTKCFSGNYDFKTIEKLYEAQDNSDNVERGILEMNGARYTFENPNVTIQAGSESRTILQSTLEKEMNSQATTCTQ